MSYNVFTGKNGNKVQDSMKERTTNFNISVTVTCRWGNLFQDFYKGATLLILKVSPYVLFSYNYGIKLIPYFVY